MFSLFLLFYSINVDITGFLHLTKYIRQTQGKLLDAVIGVKSTFFFLVNGVESISFILLHICHNFVVASLAGSRFCYLLTRLYLYDTNVF